MAETDDPEDTGVDLDEIDTATYVAAKIFGEVTLPKGISAAKADFIEASANFAQMLSYNPTIGVFGGGALDQKTREERNREADEVALDYLETAAEREDRRLEQEREEWAHSEHSLAGQTMTGDEWADISNELAAGGKARNWLVDYLMQHGQTKQEAEDTAHDIQLASSGLSKREADRTDDEKRAMQRIDSNPDADNILTDYRKARAAGFPPVSAASAQATNSNRDVSVAARADELDNTFASAPDLMEHHRAAVALPAPAATPVPPTPTGPAPSASAGLDI